MNNTPLFDHNPIVGIYNCCCLGLIFRYLMEQSTYTKQHDDMNCLLRNFDFQLSDSFSHKPISVDECKDQLEKINVS